MLTWVCRGCACPEANNLAGAGGNGQKVISFGDHHSGAEEQVCTDILLNGNPIWGPQRMGSPLVEAGFKGRLALARIYLSNDDPNTGVVITANSHSPGHDACLASAPSCLVASLTVSSCSANTLVRLMVRPWGSDPPLWRPHVSVVDLTRPDVAFR